MTCVIRRLIRPEGRLPRVSLATNEATNVAVPCQNQNQREVGIYVVYIVVHKQIEAYFSFKAMSKLKCEM